eukprot:Lithocolla_globosa_v1_NODE_45_length_8054_cov_9.461981.p4 type:complete len:273 gc:universal NODE_45_length_8054_cov_9.461981:5015-4197(-)
MDVVEEELEVLKSIFDHNFSLLQPSVFQEKEESFKSCQISLKCGYMVRISFPVGYPEVHPLVSLYKGRKALSEDPSPDSLGMRLEKYVQHLPFGQCAFDVVTWINEELLAEVDGDDADHVVVDTNDVQQPQLFDRQWLVFIGFHTKSIRRGFCQTALSLGCTGFLMPGKPAVAAVEGTQASIAEFLRLTRTDLFATVPAASRKMTVSLLEKDIVRAFDGFEEVDLTSALDKSAKGHKRKDIVDLGQLQCFLSDLGLSHAFSFMFQQALDTKS